MKKVMLLALSALVAAALLACGGSEQPPAQGGQGQVKPAGKTTVEVPEIIKGKWKGAVIVVEEKGTKATKEYTVKLGEKFTVPGSDMSVVVQDFFPSFVMQGSSITSASNEPSNPAARVVVAEGGSEIFSGWLFAKYPTTHAFSHPKFSITLKEGVPAS